MRPILPGPCGYRATIHALGVPWHPICRRELHDVSVDNDSLQREQGTTFMPRFDSHGLVTAVAIDHRTGQLLMLAHMDAEAIARTRETGLAHLWSRSRQKQWMKGETSGHVLKVLEIRVDCDQDALELRVEPAGPACHTLAQSCFYRRITPQGTLERIEV